MKMKRDEFKVMLKECILELVREGKIFQHAGSSQPSSLNEQGRRTAAPETSEQEVTPNSRLNEAVRITASLVAKGDPKIASMYEGIIADTARNTLQKQLAHQMGGGGDLMGGAGTLPEERAFDEAQLGMFAAKDRWAAMAFGNKAKNE